MPRLLPPIEHRFPANRPYSPHAGHKGPYLTPLLKKLLSKNIKYKDPETKKLIKGQVKNAILWRYIINAMGGSNQAIEGILNRIDGKVVEVIKNVQDDSALMNDEIELIPSNGKKVPNRISKFISNQ